MPAPREEPRQTRDLMTNFFPTCPKCGHPYIANFANMGLHALTGKPVCCGSLVHEICKPVIYLMFPYPLDAFSWDIMVNGERWRGVLYKADPKEEREAYE
jgi:hypothetical protein